ncbi:MAG: hypothetical protein JNL62_25620 [Bryobacterales bacterium]|nr:hypothetical protein [Bryobacterales bacterium]
MRFLVLLAASVGWAQNAPHIRDWRPPAGEPQTSPRRACREVHQITGYDLTVLTAESGSFCRVTLPVQPEIRIEVSLPAHWNNRLYMFGNGGYAGESLETPKPCGES